MLGSRGVVYPVDEGEGGMLVTRVTTKLNFANYVRLSTKGLHW